MEVLTEVNWKSYWSSSDYLLLYGYFVAVALLALYLIFKAKVAYKIEIFVFCFYLMTGNLNRFLIQDVGFFEITPERFLFLVSSFFLVRILFFSSNKNPLGSNGKFPLFMIMLFGYYLFFGFSQFANAGSLGISKVLDNLIDASNFLLIILTFQIIADRRVYDIFGKVIILTAIVTTCIGLIQLLGPDPYYMRVGSPRDAFGNVFRSSGIFSEEHHHSYFLLTAIAWTLIRMKNQLLKFTLVSFFIVGVFISFHRMSYVLMSILFLLYFLKLRKMAIDRLVLGGLAAACIVLILTMLFYRDLMDSTMVQERLADGPGGRLGYYSMVLNSVGGKPLIGYGGRKNDVYYKYMLEITRNHERAAGTTGGVHNGYLAAMFYTGIPTAICFGAFAFLSVFYFFKLASYDLFFAIPMLFGICFLIGNLTNSILFPRYIALLYALQIGLALNARYYENFAFSGTNSGVSNK